MSLYGRSFDAIHASPPCQAFSQLAARWPEREYPDLIKPLRPLLLDTFLPYVIENVEGAPLIDPVTLCGSMFDLGADDFQLRRHRAFETNWLVSDPPSCRHDARAVITVTGHAGRASRNGTGTTLQRRAAMEIPWLTSDDLVEAIPPAYTKWLGAQLLAARTEAVAA